MRSNTPRGASRLAKELGPALIVLLLTIVCSDFLTTATPLSTWEIIYRILFRFVRFTFFLCFPLYVLLPLYGFVIQKIRGSILQTGGVPNLELHSTKLWIFRPLQGIGIGLLFETKLLAALQIVTGVATRPFLFLPTGQLQTGRMLVISGIAVVISLLLSLLWTLDDMGIRYVNRKDQEMKMIGRYVGTIMPILFGFYGILTLITGFPISQVLMYLFKTVMILYPPFAFFTIFHAHFIQSRAEYFLRKAMVTKGGIWEGDERLRL